MDENLITRNESEDILLNNIHWKPSENLSTLPERYFKVCERIIDVITLKPIDKEDSIRIQHPNEGCNTTADYNEFGSLSYACTWGKKNLQYEERNISLRNSIYAPCDEKCKFPFCPYKVAAYIKYLRNTNMDELDKQRSAYISDKDVHDMNFINKYNLSYDFNLDGLDTFYISTSLLSKLKHYIDNGFFFPSKYSKDKYAYKYYYIQNDDTSKFIEGKNINDFNVLSANKFIDKETLAFGCLKDFVDINKDHIPRYLLYLIIVDYLLNKDMYQSFYDTQLELENYANKITKDFPISKNTHYFYGAVAGNDRNEVRRHVVALAYRIGNANLNGESDYTKLTLMEFSTYLTSVNEDKNSNVIGYIYKDIPLNKIFVLTGITEFIQRNEARRNNTTYINSALDHCIKKLKEFVINRYIIIAGTEDEINSLFNIDRSLRFLFSTNTIYLSDYTSEQIFEVYSNYLIDDLKQKLLSNKKFKNEFENYITFNKECYPMNNSTLGIYLAWILLKNL